MKKIWNWFIALLLKNFPELAKLKPNYPEIIRDDITDTYLLSVRDEHIQELLEGQTIPFKITRSVLLSKLHSNTKEDQLLIQKALVDVGVRIKSQLSIHYIINCFGQCEYFLHVTRLPEDADALEFPEPPRALSMTAAAGR